MTAGVYIVDGVSTLLRFENMRNKFQVETISEYFFLLHFIPFPLPTLHPHRTHNIKIKPIPTPPSQQHREMWNQHGNFSPSKLLLVRVTFLFPVVEVHSRWCEMERGGTCRLNFSFYTILSSLPLFAHFESEFDFALGAPFHFKPLFTSVSRSKTSHRRHHHLFTLFFTLTEKNHSQPCSEPVITHRLPFFDSHFSHRKQSFVSRRQHWRRWWMSAMVQEREEMEQIWNLESQRVLATPREQPKAWISIFCEQNSYACGDSRYLEQKW